MSRRLKEIPSGVYIRYGLLSIPGTVALILVLTVVRHWVAIPYWFQALLVLLWVGKEIILFPFVWRAYDHTRSEACRLMIGKTGVARERLAPTGYIRVQGELWKAEKMDSEPAIEKNERVRVIQIEGLKLFVISESGTTEPRARLLPDR